MGLPDGWLRVYSICTIRTGTDTSIPVFVISTVSFCPAEGQVFDREPNERDLVMS